MGSTNHNPPLNPGGRPFVCRDVGDWGTMVDEGRGDNDAGPDLADLGPSADFESFYRVEYPKVVALTLALTGSIPMAEDIAQEAFIATHRRWRRVAGYDRPGAFARRVALNLAVSASRRRVREAAALQRLFARPLPVPAAVGDTGFWEAVRHLPHRQRQVVALFYIEDSTVGDIATVLGLAAGTVKAHLHAARTSLARSLAAEATEEDE